MAGAKPSAADQTQRGRDHEVSLVVQVYLGGAEGFRTSTSTSTRRPPYFGVQAVAKYLKALGLSIIDHEGGESAGKAMLTPFALAFTTEMISEDCRTEDIYHSQVREIVVTPLTRAGHQDEPGTVWLSPHVFRYTRASHWKDDGVPLENISVLLRHSKLSTVIRYVRMGPVKRMKRQVDRANLFRRVSFEIPCRVTRSV